MNAQIFYNYTIIIKRAKTLNIEFRSNIFYIMRAFVTKYTIRSNDSLNLFYFLLQIS